MLSKLITAPVFITAYYMGGCLEKLLRDGLSGDMSFKQTPVDRMTLLWLWEEEEKDRL